MTNALVHTEHFTYNAVGRITTVTDRNGAITRYGYDRNGNLSSVVDALGNITLFEYDRLNRLTRVIGNEEKVTAYEYDRRGLVTKVINAAGYERVHEYDQNGNLISTTDEDGFVTRFDYDVRNLLSSISYADDRTVSHEYDKAGNQTHIHYPDGTEISHTFDELGRIKAIQTPEGVFNYTYDPVGRVLSVAMPNGITEAYEHDKIGQLLSITQRNTNSNTSEVLNQYTYDPVGNVINRTGNFNYPTQTTTQNEFNALNQLTASTTRTENGAIISNFAYAYDKRGNLIQERDIINNTVQTFTFDTSNRLISGTNHQGEESIYTYNALGVLTAHETRTANGTTKNDYVIDYTSFVPTVLMEYGNENIQRHIYGNDLSRISTTLIDTTNLITPPNAETFFIQSDRLGSARFATNTTDERVGFTSLDEWGNILEKSLPNFNGQPVDILNSFTNHQYDEILGLYYAQARFYDPTHRRFISADPHWGTHNRIYGNNPSLLPDINAIRQSANLYSYVLNNPLKYIDPWGLNGINVNLSEYALAQGAVVERVSQTHSTKGRVIYYITHNGISEYVTAVDGFIESSKLNYMFKFDCDTAMQNYEELMNRPIKITREGNNVNILAFVDIFGEGGAHNRWRHYS